MITPRSSRDYARIGLVAALLAGVLLATTATAYQSTRLLSGDQSAWLHKGRSIAQINGPSARYEATAADQPVSVAAGATDPLQIVQEADGRVYTVDPRTHRVFRLDLSTMIPQAGPPGTAILASGNHVFILDASRRTLTPVDPRTLAPGRAVRLPGPVASGAITPEGTVYLGGDGGQVYVVKGGKVTTATLTARHAPVEVSAVGGDPVAVVAATGQLFNLGSSHPVPLPLPGNPAAPVAMAPGQPAGPVWLVRGDLLVGADVGTGQVQQVTLPVGDSYEPPVANAGKVYVPDATAGNLRVFDAATLAPQPAVSVPAGVPGDHTIEAVVRDGDVWVDNPTSQDGKLVTPAGAVTTIDKGTGDGVVDPNAPAAGSAPSPAPAAAPTPAPGPAPHVAGQAGPTLPSAAPAVPVAVPGPSVPLTPAVPAAGPPTVTGPGAPVPSQPPATTTPPTAPPSTSAARATVPSVAGQDTTTACSTMTTAKLTCNPAATTYVATAAPSGKPDIVVATTPAAGASVPAGTAVQLTADDIAVPATSGSTEQYSTYCQTVNGDAFACDPVAGGQGPAGTTPGTVASVSPAPGTLEPPGTPVKVAYYTSAAVPVATVPDCSGRSPAACQAAAQAAGFNFVPQAVSVSQAIACNTVYGQEPTGGTQAAQGSTLTAQYDPNCSQILYEYQSAASADPYIHYLSFNAAPANGSWNSPTAGASAYPVTTAGVCAKAGTTPLEKFEYTSANGFQHFYFDIDKTSYSTWTFQGPVACVFPSAVPGTGVEVYDNSLGNPDNIPTGDDDWTAGGPGAGAQSSRQAWWQPKV
jgi:hypothetical protein